MKTARKTKVETLAQKLAHEMAMSVLRPLSEQQLPLMPCAHISPLGTDCCVCGGAVAWPNYVTTISMHEIKHYCLSHAPEAKK